MHRHIAQQNHILIAAQYFTASTEQTVYVSSVQGKGAEGCKELLEAFEACVKGATASLVRGRAFTCKYQILLYQIYS